MSNLDSLSFALSQISCLVNTINKKNFKNNVNEINQLISQHGEEAVRHLIRALFSSVDFQPLATEGKSNSRDYHQITFLRDEVLKLIAKPNFIALLCYAIDNPLHHHKGLKSINLLPQISKVLKLNRVQDVAFGVALLNSSNSETRTHARSWTCEKLPELLRTYVDADQGCQDGSAGGSAAIHEISIEIIHLILTQLKEDSTQFGVESTLIESFLNILRKDFPKTRVPVVLSPLLYSDMEDLPISKAFRESNGLNQVNSEAWISEILEEFGYNCTSTLDEMRITLADLTPRDLTPAAVARCISMFMRTSEGELRDQIALQGSGGSATWKQQDGDVSQAHAHSWNVDNFLTVITEMNPSLNRRQVVAELDHNGFLVSSKTAFSVLKQCISRLTGDKFPVDIFYNRWQNVEGQFSFLQKCVQHPDIICLAYWPYQAVDLSRLKQPPDDDSNNRDIQIWKNVDYMDILLDLSDHGVYKEVYELLQFPVQKCPDVFVLTLLQTKRTNNLKLEYLWRLFRIFMNPQAGANSASIFQYAWSLSQDSSLIRTLIMHSMAEYYVEGEQTGDTTRLGRIFDIIADVKALNMLLNANPPFFVLDLAIMGTKREYIKLQKWLGDRLQESGEQFAKSVISFLRRRAPRLFGLPEDLKDPKVIILDNSMVNDIFTCLQLHSSNYSKEMQDTITNLCSNFWRICPNRSLTPAATAPSLAPGLAPGATRPVPSASSTGNSTASSVSSSQLHGVTSSALVSSFDTLTSAMGHMSLGSQMQQPSAASATTTAAAAAALVKKNVAAGGMFADQLTGFNPVGPPPSSQSQFSSLSNTSSQPMGALTKLAAPIQQPSATGIPPASMAQGHSNPSVTAVGSGAMLPPQMVSTQNRFFNPVGKESAGKPPPDLSLAARPRQPGPQQIPPPPPPPNVNWRPIPVPPELEGPFNQQCAREVTQQFGTLFSGKVSPEQFISDMKELRRGPNIGNANKSETLRCFLRYCIDEFQHVPKEYPESAASIMAEVYGCIINEGLELVSHNVLGMFMRLVLISVSKPNMVTAATYDNRLFDFGVTALNKCKQSLRTFRMIQAQLINCTNFAYFPKDLQEHIQFVAYNSMSQDPTLPPGSSNQGVQGPGRTLSISRPPIFPSHHLQQPNPQNPAISDDVTVPTMTETLGPPPSVPPTLQTANVITANVPPVAGQIEIQTPPETVADKVMFLFNNMSMSNVSEKAKELIDAVPSEYAPWVAQYMVMKRVSAEPNFHSLFVQLIDCLTFPEFPNIVLQQVFRNIKVLMQNLKPDMQDFNDRTLLKNLGHFLGLLTLGKNRPILYDEINMKDLIYEAYHKGMVEMIYVIPFVARTLEGAKESIVFRPPNPWTMGLLKVLKEAHGDANIRMNLKFEIELLCKQLSVEFDKLQASNFLRDNKHSSRVFTVQQLRQEKKEGDQERGLRALAAGSVTVGSSSSAAGGGTGAGGAGSGGGSGVVTSSSNAVSIAAAMAPDPMGTLGQESASGYSSAAIRTRMIAGDALPLSHQAMVAAGLNPLQVAQMQQQQIHSGQQAAVGNQGGMQMAQAGASSQAPPHLSVAGGGAHITSVVTQPISQMAGQANLPSVTAMSGLQGAHLGSGVQPRYRYSDIEIGDPSCFDRLLVIDENLPILKARPPLKSSVRHAVERTIGEVVPAVVDRCNRIILTTVEHIIRKDFAFDSEENRVKQCAQGMTRFLASGMALITGREALMMQLANNLKNVFLTQMSNCTQQQKELAEQAAQTLAVENVELCIAYVQKTVAETCIRDVDSRLSIDYQNRMKARNEKRSFYDPVEYQYQMQKMPDRLKKSVNGPHPSDLMVYQEFQRNIPGFLPVTGGVPDLSMSSSVAPVNPMLQPHMMAGLPPAAAAQVPGNQGFNINGPNGVNTSTTSGTGVSQSMSVPSELTTMYDKIIIEIERQLTTISSVLRSTTDRLVIQLRTLIDAAVLAKKSSMEPNIASRVVYKTIMSLMDNYDKSKMCANPISQAGQYSQEILERFKEAHLHILRSMLQPDASPYGLTWVNRQTTKAWIEMDENSGKWNADAFIELLKIHVINLNQLDQYIVTKIKEHNENAITFAMTLIEQLILLENREFTVLNEWDVFNTLELINTVVQRGLLSMSNVMFEPRLWSRLIQMNVKLRELLDFGLLEPYHSVSTTFLYSGCSQAREFDDPPTLSEKSEFLMRQYMEIYNSHRQKDRTTFVRFMATMQQYDIFKSDETITRFFRLTSGFVIERCLSKLKTEQGADAKAPNVRMPCYLELDAYAHLVTMLVLYSSEQVGNQAASGQQGQPPASQAISVKVNLLNKVLGIIAGTLLQEHDVRPDWFHAMPFHRLFIMLFVELTSSDYDPVLSTIAPQVLIAFVNTLHILRPTRVPMFAYAWIEIISHRVFIGKVLASKLSQSTHPMYAQLMVDLLKFLAQYLANSLIPKPICFLYKGTLRVLLVLIHDFPEFISDYHALFCDIIPSNSLQLRNLILSAMPKNGVMIDPFKSNLAFESIESIGDPTGYCATADTRIRPPWLKQQLDAYLNHRQSVNFLTDLTNYLKVQETGLMDPIYSNSTRYNVEVMNALVLYLAITAISTIREKKQTLNRTTVAHTPQMDILQNLIINLDNEGRYHLLNAMANQLRYLNSHTLYFYLVFCYLFLEVENSSVREQITRVLMERLLVQRPHPWGLLRTFYEIMENPTYKFWENEFARCHPDIERMLENVPHQCWPHLKGARSHLVNPNQSGQSMPDTSNAIQSSTA